MSHFIWNYGEILEGLVIDHLNRNFLCSILYYNHQSSFNASKNTKRIKVYTLKDLKLNYVINHASKTLFIPLKS